MNSLSAGAADSLGAATAFAFAYACRPLRRTLFNLLCDKRFTSPLTRLGAAEHPSCPAPYGPWQLMHLAGLVHWIWHTSGPLSSVQCCSNPDRLTAGRMDRDLRYLLY